MPECLILVERIFCKCIFLSYTWDTLRIDRDLHELNFLGLSFVPPVSVNIQSWMEIFSSDMYKSD